jgi:YD repeat-containing protein
LWLVLPFYFYGRLLTSEAYRLSIDLAVSSPEVQSVLGKKIHAQWLPVGSALRSYQSDFAEWSVSLSGSAGSGRLYGVANKIGIQWEFSRLSLVPANGGPTIDLTPAPARLNLPPPAYAKKVYLVPIDLSPQQSLGWAPAYYKAKLGIEVDILPPINLGPSSQDPARHQLIAEKCVDVMAQSYRELASDPSAILIGVTSRDMFIDAFNWSYAENLREYGRMGIVSAARLGPTDFPGKWNRELLNSRLRKMLTKNVVILYFDLPLSNDYTSLLSAGVLSGKQVDYMGGRIVGASGRWDSFYNEGEPTVSIVATQDKPMSWVFACIQQLPDRSPEIFNAYVGNGLFIQRKTDFYLDGDYPLEFTRVYGTQDDLSRSFGVGAQHSLDIFLAGQMGEYVRLNLADGGKIRFDHVDPKLGQRGDIYRAVAEPSGRFAGTEAIYEDGVWHLRTRDGWTYLFPYRPNARPAQVTVLTGFQDPSGHKTEMTRNDSGDLLNVTTPSGKWLRFEYDSAHRIRRITDSQGRVSQYAYDAGGRLSQVTDPQGYSEAYTYDDRNEMLSVMDGKGAHILSNQYSSTGLIAGQTLADGRHLAYAYQFSGHNVIGQAFLTHPNGLMTSFDYGPDGYVQSLPWWPAR